MDLLLSFGQWLESFSIPTWVRNTLWGYPYVQLVHFTGLSLWIGTVVILDLRLLGLTGRDQTIAQFSKQLFLWKWIGLGIGVTGGFFLFASIATTYIQNPAFQIKLPLLLTGVVYHVLVHRNVERWDQLPATSRRVKLAGLFELALWVGVILAAVEIPNN